MHRSRLLILLLSAAVFTASLLLGSPGTAQAAVPDAPRCSTSGTWQQGELTIYWFDVEQGDSQLVVGPTGRTLLLDLGERAYNSTGTNTAATRIAAEIRSICGIASGPVHLDYVMASHHHLDHIGYAGNPNDGTSSYGNGLYQLLTPASSGGYGFTVGQVLDRDGGVWTDSNGDSDCDVGTSAEPSTETAWHNVGTTSLTSKRWICWLYGPAGQADRAHIEGKVLRVSNTNPWPSIDLGTGVSAEVVEANGKDVMQSDGRTPVSGDHSTSATPPSENDYSIAVRTAFGPFTYGTAGDSDGEYATSVNGYTYNDIESVLSQKMGVLAALRANHHGSDHSSSNAYVNATSPQVGFVSCGNNSYGHPGNRALDAFRAVGADLYLANNPCDTVDTTGAAIDYAGTYNKNGTVRLATGGDGAQFTVTYDAGSRSYTTSTSGGGGGGGATGDATQVQVNEVLMAPSGTGGEWVELYNPTSGTVDVGGYFVDDVAGGGGAPKQIPAGTTIPAGGRWVMEMASGFFNNTGAESVRFLKVASGVETVYDSYAYSLGSTPYDQVFHRTGDGGAWCDTVSANVTKGTQNPSSCP